MSVPGSIAGLYWLAREAATSAFDHYPKAIRALVPEIADPPRTTEPRATCSTCALSPEHSGARPTHPWAFHPKVRCCTFNPALPNFLVGQALSRGGISEERMRARLRDLEGVDSWGVRPSAAWVEDYENRHRGAFGRDPSMKCPYWVDGPFGCAIWKDRNHVCRTWFCKHDAGSPGRDWWRHTKDALVAAESLLADLCAGEGKAPADGAAPDDWERYFRWCAVRVEGLAPSEIERLKHPELTKRRKLVAAGPPDHVPEADVVVASVTHAEKDGDRVWVTGYSAYDVVRLPFSVFLFFSLLDGRRPWREALAQTNAQGGAPLGEADVRELFRIGAIRSPLPGDVRGTEGDDPDMQEVGDGVFMAFRTDAT